MPDLKLDFDKILETDNIVEMLDDESLNKISKDCIEGLEIDQKSRSEWDQKTKEAMDMAKQVQSIKTTPWMNAANVKFPLMTIAAIQYAARAYPEFIRDGRTCNATILGEDPDGERQAKAKRISDHMSWQMLVDSDDWEDGVDRGLILQAIVGMIFKKSRHDPIEKKHHQDLCLPDTIYVNQSITSLEDAPRISHITPMYLNEIIEKIRYKIFVETDLSIFKCDSTEGEQYLGEMTDQFTTTDTQDSDLPRQVLEQHCRLDLDGDSYKEPYIVFIDLATETVLRIEKRFSKDTADQALDGTVRKIFPWHYFTAYPFIPAMDGTFYAYGFGQLLLPINETINTTINQLLDAGTLNSMSSGLLGAEFRSQKGNIKVIPGEYIQTQVPGQVLAQAICHMPTKEPSNVLFQLLGMMMDFGKELSACTDIMQGQQDAQNVPATTMLKLIEQGMKVYSSLLKRYHRSFKKDLKKWFDMNVRYLDEVEYFQSMQSPKAIKKTDYDPKHIGVMPISDPSVSSDAQRLARGQVLLQTYPMLNPIGQRAALKLYYEAVQFPESEIMQLLPLPDPQNPPPIPPDVAKANAEADLLKVKSQTAMLEQQFKQVELQLRQEELQLQKFQVAAKAEQQTHMGHKADAQAMLDVAKAQHEHMAHIDGIQQADRHHAADTALEIAKMQTDLQKEHIKAAAKAKGPSND